MAEQQTSLLRRDLLGVLRDPAGRHAGKVWTRDAEGRWGPIPYTSGREWKFGTVEISSVQEFYDFARRASRAGVPHSRIPGLSGRAVAARDGSSLQFYVSPSRGRTNRNTLPAPADRFSTQICPPCISTKDRLMDSPSPVPEWPACDSVPACSNGLKILSIS